MDNVKQHKLGAIYKIAAFIAMVLIGYLSIRGYKDSVEKLKINGCINEVGILVENIQQSFRNELDYMSLNYTRAVELKIIPLNMMREHNEAYNSYSGGIDFFYSSLHVVDDNKAFEIAFQGLSSTGCKALMRIAWDNGDNFSYIAVAGFPELTPSGVMDEILMSTKQEDITRPNVFRASKVRFVSDDLINNACACSEDTCTVVWKFH